LGDFEATLNPRKSAAVQGKRPIRRLRADAQLRRNAVKDRPVFQSLRRAGVQVRSAGDTFVLCVFQLLGPLSATQAPRSCHPEPAKTARDHTPARSANPIDRNVTSARVGVLLVSASRETSNCDISGIFRPVSSALNNSENFTVGAALRRPSAD